MSMPRNSADLLSKKTNQSWEDAVSWLKAQPEFKLLAKACYYDDPVDAAAERYYSDPEWKSIRNFLPANKGTALDVGSGRGISAFALASDGWEVTALEPDPSLIVGSGAIRELFLKKGMRVNIVESWGEKLPFDDASFDLIHARQVLHHAKNLKIFCEELYRVLKPGGTLIATREHVISKESDLQVFLNNHPLHHIYGGENAFTLDTYVSALTLAGFQITKKLSPLESPINFSPMSMDGVKNQIGKKIFGPLWSEKLIDIIPELLITFISRKILKTPGRLYTFVASKGDEIA